ncbi:dodecin [Lichenicoccus roseus]|uniref:Dodecin domain-containing protein n=1 Tax=Lichenicoccus roseus TaxID=2683649 RepID=A0A5R9JI40_9PROT|nr:dodecin [Lichenicoccus roseus]TLU73988.1 dodecin domain-containing protein [Lichenicoccus roseus]
MADHVYRVTELVGSSETSIEAAIQAAISKASNTVRHMRWFEVIETRGHIENNKLSHYQVTLKVGFSVEDENVHLQP